MNNTDVPRSKKELAEKLRRIRIQIADATQKEFADSLGVSRVYIAQLESPDSPKYPSPSLLRQISDTYHVDYTYLAFEDSGLHTDSWEEDQIIALLERQDLFRTTDQSQESPLLLIAQNYHRLIHEELENTLRPNGEYHKIHEQHLDTFYTLYQPILNTLKELKEILNKQKEPPTELWEKYMENVETAIETLTTPKDGKTNE